MVLTFLLNKLCQYTFFYNNNLTCKRSVGLKKCLRLRISPQYTARSLANELIEGKCLKWLVINKFTPANNGWRKMILVELYIMLKHFLNPRNRLRNLNTFTYDLFVSHFSRGHLFSKHAKFLKFNISYSLIRNVSFSENFVKWMIQYKDVSDEPVNPSRPDPGRKRKLTLIFIFTLLCGAESCRFVQVCTDF